jgi:hypothetical protein
MSPHDKRKTVRRIASRIVSPFLLHSPDRRRPYACRGGEFHGLMPPVGRRLGRRCDARQDGRAFVLGVCRGIVTLVFRGGFQVAAGG